jgi:hypothetical protein
MIPAAFLKARWIQERSDGHGAVGQNMQRVPIDVVGPANRMGRKLAWRHVDEDVGTRTLECYDVGIDCWSE